MKYLSYIFILFGCISFFGCKEEIKNSNMDLIVTKGEAWSEPKGYGPQLVLWLEDNGGNYISTLFITQKSAKKNFNRPEALPVWEHKKNNSQKLDAVSGATTQAPSYKGHINKDLLVSGNKYNVFLEINNSFDYNDFWHETNSGVNGQPSLVYCGTFSAGQEDRIEISSNPIGYGSVDGSNGTITNETKNLTTALKILNEAHIIIK